MYLNPTFGKVGERLKQFRKQYNWVLQDTCDKVNEISQEIAQTNPNYKVVKLNPSHLSKIENNDIDTSDYYIALLCEAYKITMSDLYNTSEKSDNSLLHLPPHLRDFVNEPQNVYLITTAYNLKDFNSNEKESIRKFLRLLNI
jgi:transcriptional regulator with XRE-family HTH domain